MKHNGKDKNCDTADRITSDQLVTVLVSLTAKNREKSSMVLSLGRSAGCNLSTCSIMSREALPASSGGVPTAIACSTQTYSYTMDTMGPSLEASALRGNMPAPDGMAHGLNIIRRPTPTQHNSVRQYNYGMPKLVFSFAQLQNSFGFGNGQRTTDLDCS